MDCKTGLLVMGAMFLPALVNAQAANAARPEKPQAAAAMAPSTPNAFVKDFTKHWATAKDLAGAIAEAMPEEHYGFKPNPEEMSFGEQMLHIAQANYGYCAAMTDGKSPLAEPEKDAKIAKADTEKQLAGSFDYCMGVFEKLTDAQLDATHGPEGHKFATRDIMLGVMIHMVHHRGQAEVYLRLKGITPPKYKW